MLSANFKDPDQRKEPLTVFSYLGMATKRTLSVILLHENSDDTINDDVQTVLENAASALHQASLNLSKGQVVQVPVSTSQECLPTTVGTAANTSNTLISGTQFETVLPVKRTKVDTAAITAKCLTPASMIQDNKGPTAPLQQNMAQSMPSKLLK